MNSPFKFRFSNLKDFLNGDQPTHNGEIVYLTDNQEMYCWVNDTLRKVKYVYTGSNLTYPTGYEPSEYISSFESRQSRSEYCIGYLISEEPIQMDVLPKIDDERLGELL